MADDTATIQAALDVGGIVIIKEGTYWIDATKSLRPRSNSNILLDGVTLKVIPNSEENYKLFMLQNIQNVTMIGGMLIGDRASHKGTTGEWGMGVSIKQDCVNITLSKMKSIGMWGDGFYVGCSANKNRPKNVIIDSCVADKNRRQGLSITAVDTCRVTGSTFSHTGGTDPMDGIDIETDADNVINGVRISGCKFLYNRGVGIELAGKRGIIKDVKIWSNTFTGNVALKIWTDNLLTKIARKAGLLSNDYAL